MASGINVTKMAEEPSWDQGGKLSWKVRVTYYDDDHGPFSMLFDKDGFNGIAARAALEQQARDLRVVRGT